MSAWHLLWMFVTALGVIALSAATPFIWLWAREREGAPRAAQRRLYRKVIQAYLRNGGTAPSLQSCLYCGGECEFGPNCANRWRSPAARARRTNERLLEEMPHLRERAAREMAALAPVDVDPLNSLPCPCARCGKTATLLGAFQNNAGHIFCGWTCYNAGGRT